MKTLLAALMRTRRLWLLRRSGSQRISSNLLVLVGGRQATGDSPRLRLGPKLLLLEEHQATMQGQPLVPSGLSPREAQVLDWVAQGKTNREMDVILELSRRRVQKHLEQIYRKILLRPGLSQQPKPTRWHRSPASNKVYKG